jgi:hypothetical protein
MLGRHTCSLTAKLKGQHTNLAKAQRPVNRRGSLLAKDCCRFGKGMSLTNIEENTSKSRTSQTCVSLKAKDLQSLCDHVVAHVVVAPSTAIKFQLDPRYPG